MTFEEIKKQVNDIIYDVLKDRIEYKDITADKHLTEDLQAESSEALEIFLTLMVDFDVEFDRKYITQMKNLNDIYLYIKELLDKKAGVPINTK